MPTKIIIIYFSWASYDQFGFFGPVKFSLIRLHVIVLALIQYPAYSGMLSMQGYPAVEILFYSHRHEVLSLFECAFSWEKIAYKTNSLY